MKKSLNIPNILSTIRILLSPVFLLLVFYPSNFNIVLIVTAIFVIASFTDFLDGYLARKYGEITKIGQILDPVADKLMITFALLTFVYIDVIPFWIVTIILFRELSITIHRFYLANKDRIIPATNSGKYKVVSQVFMIFLVLVALAISIAKGKAPSWLSRIVQCSIWLALILSVVSGWEYVSQLSSFPKHQ